jgi:hypothetical protein
MKALWAWPNREQIIRRSGRLLVAGVALLWLGVFLFSLGLVEYCAECRDTVSDGSTQRTLVLLPIGLTISLFASGVTVLAAAVLLGAWVWGRPIPRISVLAVAALLVAFVSYVPLPSWAAANGLTMNWPGQSKPRDSRLLFSVGPLTVAADVPGGSYRGGGYASYNIGYSTISGGTRWAWPILLALPASLVCIPWTLLWWDRQATTRLSENGIESSLGDDVALHHRLLKRIFWSAAAAAAAFVALEVAWYRIYVGDYPLNPEAAVFFRALAHDFGGGLATLALGAMLAAATGLFVVQAWRLSMRKMMAIVALCAAVLGVARWFVGDQLVAENGALVALATVEPLEYPPGVTQQDIASQFGISPPMTTTDLRLPLVEPFSWLGPGSIALVALPFVILAIFYHRLSTQRH